MSKQTAEQAAADYAEKKWNDGFFSSRQEIADDFLSGVQYAGAKEWISVEERLPDCHKIENGKKSINWVLGANGKNRFVCVYTKGHELEYGDEDPSDEEFDEIESQHGCLYLKPGWYELEETPRGEYEETWVRRKPTSWMTLPPLPTK